MKDLHLPPEVWLLAGIFVSVILWNLTLLFLNIK